MKDIKLDLAKTNFLISKVRDKLNNSCEVYYKWTMLKAFNAASYTYDNKTVRIECFYLEEVPKNLLSEKFYDYFGTKIFVEAEEKLLMEIETSLKNWEREFNELWDNQSNELLFQIKCLQLWIIYLDANEPSVMGEVFLKRIVELFNDNILFTNCLPSISFSPLPNQWHQDAEIIFQKPLDESYLLQSLNTLGVIEGCLFGFGSAFGDIFPMAFNQGLQNIHFTARHF